MTLISGPRWTTTKNSHAMGTGRDAVGNEILVCSHSHQQPTKEKLHIRKDDTESCKFSAAAVTATAAVDYGYGDAAPDSAAAEATVDYGYGDAAPDSAVNKNNLYGYGDAAPDTAATVDYGYGDAAPDSAVNNTNSNPYGYGDGAPDTASAPAVDYGYGEASPDSAAGGGPTRTTNSNNPYGYGDEVSPDLYGYGDAAPAVKNFDHRPTRRSSMKTSGVPRRSSIGYTGEKEVVLPGNRKIQRRTSISFDEGVQVQTVPSVPELVDNNTKDIWFQAEEYNKIAKRSVALVELVEKHGLDGFQGKKPCVRGLEALSSEGQYEKVMLRNDAWDTVFVEQHLQREDGTFIDDEAIAKMYKLSTVSSKMEATRRAKLDEKEIEQYTMDTRRFCRRLSM